MSKTASIYAIRFAGKIIYVGQTTMRLSTRFAEHLSRARLGRMVCRALYEHMQKNDFYGYTYELLELAPEETKHDREQFWIKKHKTRTRGCNLTKGGSAARGEDHYMWGKPAHPAALAASLLAHKGKPQSAEWRAAISRGNKGKHHGKTSHPVVCSNGMEFPSILACAQHFNVSMFMIQMIVKGKSDGTKRRKLKGLEFKLKEKPGDVDKRNV